MCVDDERRTSVEPEDISQTTAIEVTAVRRYLSQLTQSGWIVPIDGGYQVMSEGRPFARVVRGGRR
jgi:predicted transcriptional regulator